MDSQAKHSRRTRIVLADDHPLIRGAIARLLATTTEFELVGEATEGKECLPLVQKLQPDILVLDIGMPEMNGEEVARQLRHLCPKLKIVVLSGYTEPHHVRAMIDAGAIAYVVKSASGCELIQALQTVASGASYLSPEIAGAVIRRSNSVEAIAKGPRTATLGRREQEVLKLVAEGNRSDAIAKRMEIAVLTVETHRRNILHKLDLHSVADLTRYAIRHGMVSLTAVDSDA